jgi:hypothetical protein
MENHHPQGFIRGPNGKEIGEIDDLEEALTLFQHMSLKGRAI